MNTKKDHANTEDLELRAVHILRVRLERMQAMHRVHQALLKVDGPRIYAEALTLSREIG